MIKAININRMGKGNGLYITFDDGPSTNLTPKVLELLDSANAKATFFLLGKHIDQNKELAETIYRKGHLIGEHSYFHSHPWKSGPIRSAKDLIKGWLSARKIDEKYRSKYFRPPYGKFNLMTLLYVFLWRKKVIFWNIDPKDYMISNVDSNLRTESDSIKNGSVILLHDGRERQDENPQTTIELLEVILEKSKKDNLKCISVDNVQ